MSNDLQKQIKSLETQEINRSQMRANPTPQNQADLVKKPVETLGVSKPVSAVSVVKDPLQPSMPPSFPAPPLPTCTQGELGMEQGVKYQDDFEKDLAFLKQDLGVMKNDPVQSVFYDEATRRQPLDPKAVEELDFEKALADLKVSQFTPGEPLGNNPEGAPGATRGHPDLSAMLSSKNVPGYVPPLQRTKIFNSGFDVATEKAVNPPTEQAAQQLPTDFPTFPGHPTNPQAPGYNMPTGPSSLPIMPTAMPFLPSQPPINKQPQVQHRDQQTYVKFLRSVGI